MIEVRGANQKIISEKLRNRLKKAEQISAIVLGRLHQLAINLFLVFTFLDNK